MRALTVLGLALAFAGIGASVFDLPDEVGFACFGLAAVLLVVVGVMGAHSAIARFRLSKPQPQPPVSTPQPSPGIRPATAPEPSLLRASGTNDGHFPRVESAGDSLGNVAKQTTTGELYAMTEQILRPGQKVSFELEASDPNGDDLELSAITPGGSEADVEIRDGIVTWKVRDEDISDPAHVHIYVSSQRGYHRRRLFDDGASFIYRVLPRL